MSSPRGDSGSTPGLVRGIAEELREGARRPAESDRVSYRPIRILGLLLILQTVVLLLLDFSRVTQLGWRRLLPGAPWLAFEDAVFLAVFGPATVLTLLAGLSFLLLARRGWLVAALSQGLSLSGCLWFYANGQPNFVYPIMLYCVVVILYLNSRDVRVRFQPRLRPRQEPAREVPREP